MIEKQRGRKRCPACQFISIFAIILLTSFVVLFVFNVLPSLTNKGEFQISSASTYERNNSIVVDADLIMDFTDEVVEALENGIPLTVAVEVQVYRERIAWWNVVLKESVQLFELRYHPLTNVHEVKNIATDDRYSFNSRQDAMAVLGTIRGAHLIQKNKLIKDANYFVKMRTLLDISRLPPALRQIASLSSSWRLESPWYRWKISGETKTMTVKTEEPPELVPGLKTDKNFQHQKDKQEIEPQAGQKTVQAINNPDIQIVKEPVPQKKVQKASIPIKASPIMAESAIEEDAISEEKTTASIAESTIVDSVEAEQKTEPIRVTPISLQKEYSE